jgi:hypothetical protein
MAGLTIASVVVYPLQFIGREKRLLLHSSIELVIHCASGSTASDYLPFDASAKSFVTCRKMIEALVENPQDIALQGDPQPHFSRMLSGEPYDHVIVTSSELSSYFEPLTAWHTKRGLRDTVFTTDWIYTNYRGTTAQERIRAFVIDAYSTWGTMFFLMGGENETVPFEYRNYYIGSTPSDQYYSDFDDDWLHEVFVGRVPADNSTQIADFVQKVLTYEKTPPTQDYPLNVLMIGMDLAIPPDVPTPCEDLNETICSYLPPRYSNTITKVYDSDSGNHKDAAMTALNAGQHLVNHADHGYYDWMGVGAANHEWHLFDSEIDGLSNYNKLSIVVSLACVLNSTDLGDCIGEHFVVHNPHRAGIAFTGNTRSGLFYYGYPETLSGHLDREWWEGLFIADETNLGETLVYAKHQFATDGADSNITRHCEWTFCLLGEPEMPIWTDQPGSLLVMCDSGTCTGLQSYEVNVYDLSTSGQVPGAFVCLWKGSEVYERGYTDESGFFSGPIYPGTAGVMSVTVTKHNYLPWERECSVKVYECVDTDGDGFGDPGHPENCCFEDNCPAIYNPDQSDSDHDGYGDVCDICGDADASGAVDIDDVVNLISYIFAGGPEPAPYESGDADCSGDVDIDDVVWLIAYIFSGGNAPCDTDGDRVPDC